MISGEQRRQACCRRAFHRPQREIPGRFTGMHDAHRFVAQRQNALGIVEEVMAHGGQADALLLADKQIGAQFEFELAQAGGQVRRDTMQLLCRTRQRTGFRYAAKHP
ncbi:hypothetical protein SRABI106_02595 [Rahnella aquatilis]|nr:hypothetical protein SRABI106_02595 [Rahnella aquatilis]